MKNEKGKQTQAKDLEKQKDLRIAKLKRIAKKAALLIPFIIGVTGYLAINPEEYSDALYFSLRLYGMNFDSEASTLLLEVARWSALIATTSVVISVIKRLYNRFFIQIMLLRRRLFGGELTIIYGDNSHSRTLEEDLKKQKIKCAITEEIVAYSKALTHVIMFDDQAKNLKFFCENSDRFAKDSKVHVWLEKFEASVLNTQDVNLDVFSLAEIIAQKFWMDKFKEIHELVINKPKDNPTVKIALIGSGINIEKLLDYAAQLNIYTLDQQIEYHVFGDLKDYQDLHYNLPVLKYDEYNKVSIYQNDSIYFYKDTWKANAKLFKDVDMLIICDSLGDNFEVYSEFQMYVVKNKDTEVCIFSDLERVIDKEKANNLFLFGNIQDVLTSEHILHSDITRRAKQVNLYYDICFAGSDVNVKDLTADLCWAKLNDFLKQSNIFTSYYWNTRKAKINDIDIKLVADKSTINEKEINIANFDVENFDTYSELEHVRWARFHYMHNWVYKNIKKKDAVNRYHPCLVDYNKLDEDTKNKDKVTIVVALKEEITQ